MHARSVKKESGHMNQSKPPTIGHVPLPAIEAEHFKENVMPIFTISYFLIVLCIKHYIPNLFLSFHPQFTNKIPRRFYSRQGTFSFSIFTLRPTSLHHPPFSKSSNSFCPFRLSGNLMESINGDSEQIQVFCFHMYLSPSFVRIPAEAKSLISA